MRKGTFAEADHRGAAPPRTSQEVQCPQRTFLRLLYPRLERKRTAGLLSFRGPQVHSGAETPSLQLPRHRGWHARPLYPAVLWCRLLHNATMLACFPLPSRRRRIGTAYFQYCCQLCHLPALTPLAGSEALQRKCMYLGLQRRMSPRI